MKMMETEIRIPSGFMQMLKSMRGSTVSVNDIILIDCIFPRTVFRTCLLRKGWKPMLSPISIPDSLERYQLKGPEE